MYICNINKMIKYIGGYYEDFKKEVEDARQRNTLDKETECICNLELNLTTEMLELLEKYKKKTNEL